MINHQTFLEILRELLPADAEIAQVPHRDDFIVRFSWKLDNDPKRPYKRSKTVVLRITQNALKDFANVGNKREAKAIIDFETYLKNQLANFDPDHNMPRGKPEPVEKWEVGSLLYPEQLKLAKGVRRRMF